MQTLKKISIYCVFHHSREKQQNKQNKIEPNIHLTIKSIQPRNALDFRIYFAVLQGYKPRYASVNNTSGAARERVRKKIKIKFSFNNLVVHFRHFRSHNHHNNRLNLHARHYHIHHLNFHFPSRNFLRKYFRNFRNSRPWLLQSLRPSL